MDLPLSIVVPLYNEEQNVRLLYANIVQAIGPLEGDYEVIFIDDGSGDKTFEVAAALCENDPRLRVIKFRRNYGQTPAMQAGIDHARGDIIVTMDGDLQNDPADIPRFIDLINEGYDIVVGWRYKRQDKLLTRKVPSKVANWLIGKVTGVPIKDNGCSLKAYRAGVIKTVPLYSEMHRFIPAMLSMTGARVAEIKVRHHARRFGESKYGLSRIYKVLLDLLTIKTIVAFATRPLRWFSILGVPLLVIGLAAVAASAYVSIIEGSAFFIVIAGVGVITMAAGCFLFLIGLVGELIYKSGNVKVPMMVITTARIDDE